MRRKSNSSSTAILFLFLLTLASGFILGSSVKKGFVQKIQSRIESKISKKEADFDGKLVLFKEPEPLPPPVAPKQKIYRSNYVQRRYVVDEPRWVQPRYVSQEEIEETTIPASSSRDRGKRTN